MTWRRYLVEFSETRLDENGHTVPVLPWDAMGVESQWIAKPDGRGGYEKGWILASVNVKDHSVFDRIPTMTPLPEDSPEKEVRGSTAQELAALQKIVQVAELRAAPQDAEKVRDVLTTLGKELKPGFDISRLRAG